MKELAGRLTAVDPDAGATVRVIAYFDALGESRAGLEALVRGAAVLAGCPARLVDVERRVRIRVEPDGRRRDDELAPDPAWPSAALVPDGVPALWLERTGTAEPSVVDAVILERAAGALRLVLDRTRGRVPLSPADDPALVETVLDPAAGERARLHAARRLGLDATGTRARALASLGGRPRIMAVHGDGRPDEAELPAGRVGVGPAVPVLLLPGSWEAARTALRFTSEGTARDPGERVVHAEDLGGLALLAELIAPGSEPPPDVRDLERAAADAPWMLATLHAVAATASLRAAATEVNVHHSTLQDRLAHAETLLGWPVRTPRGRLRLHLALSMRHLARG
ncbi:helix-turn-helix domain-containing protein [Streptomyces tailanensis]|uniref:helix-turn-helix domain-containing protein n=1 Tax=Streptomyces tailanensis TaxID=2569858 RepID=UPI00122DE419|nr:helix-turn-helix domain-containing protein [Streptomyces tailanensis]